MINNIETNNLDEAGFRFDMLKELIIKGDENEADAAISEFLASEKSYGTDFNTLWDSRWNGEGTESKKRQAHDKITQKLIKENLLDFRIVWMNFTPESVKKLLPIAIAQLQAQENQDANVYFLDIASFLADKICFESVMNNQFTSKKVKSEAGLRLHRIKELIINSDKTKSKATEIIKEFIYIEKALGTDFNTLWDSHWNGEGTESKKRQAHDKITQTLIEEKLLDFRVVWGNFSPESVKKLLPIAIAQLQVQENQDADASFLDIASVIKDKICFESVMNNKFTSKQITIDIYLNAMLGVNFAREVFKKYMNNYSIEEIDAYLRSDGLSTEQINCARYILDLSKKEDLTDLENQIFNSEYSDITNLVDQKDSNGSSTLLIAIGAGKYDLATKLIDSGASVCDKNEAGVNPIELVILISNFGMGETKKQLLKSIADKIEEVDTQSSSGRTLVDALVMNQDLEESVLQKTKDPLFHFLKEGNTQIPPSEGKVNIAISHAEGMWSTNIWAFARKAKLKYPNVEFYLITKDLVDKDSDGSFMKQFSGFINPGSGDTYPKYKEEFKKEDCPFRWDIEKLYQAILQKTDQYHLPYLGICAGAQHLVLQKKGALMPLKGYEKGKHTITFQKGTLGHFLSLTSKQQKEAFVSKQLPDVSFKAETAHHYAGINGKLGEEMVLGAKSETDVCMGYSYYKSGIVKIGIQFHPEHDYIKTHSVGEVIHQRALLDNWISLAIMKKHGTLDKYLHKINIALSEYNETHNLDAIVDEPEEFDPLGNLADLFDDSAYF